MWEKYQKVVAKVVRRMGKVLKRRVKNWCQSVYFFLYCKKFDGKIGGKTRLNMMGKLSEHVVCQHLVELKNLLDNLTVQSR